eukprot:1628269-Amphidinium_carterae.1
MDATQRARQRRIATTSPSPWKGSMLVYAWGATLELRMDTRISISTRCAQGSPPRLHPHLCAKALGRPCQSMKSNMGMWDMKLHSSVVLRTFVR